MMSGKSRVRGVWAPPTNSYRGEFLGSRQHGVPAVVLAGSGAGLGVDPRGWREISLRAFWGAGGPREDEHRGASGPERLT